MEFVYGQRFMGGRQWRAQVTMYEPSGQHLFADLYGILPDKLNNPAIVEQLLLDSAKAAGATILSSHFHNFGNDHGVTGVVLLAESHISIHTWPEFGFAAVDIFMCGDAKPQLALEVMQQAFDAKSSSVKTMTRGIAHRILNKRFNS